MCESRKQVKANICGYISTDEDKHIFVDFIFIIYYYIFGRYLALKINVWTKFMCHLL